MSEDWDYPEDEFGTPRDDDYLWRTACNRIPIQLGDSDVSESAKGKKSATLEDLDIEKRKLEIRKLTAEAERHELEALRARRETVAWDASADEHRIYNFFGAVDGSTCMAAQDVLGNWARRGGGEFTVVFNSPGGSVIHGLALFDFLENIKVEYDVHLTTIARGMAASMGGILLQAGDHRIIGSNAHVLIHEVSSIGFGKISEIEDELAFMRKLQGRCSAILASKSTMTQKQIENKWKKKDWWLDADEAVELGFADEIG